jgi:hypothetical protein
MQENRVMYSSMQWKALWEAHQRDYSNSDAKRDFDDRVFVDVVVSLRFQNSVGWGLAVLLGQTKAYQPFCLVTGYRPSASASKTLI